VAEKERDSLRAELERMRAAQNAERWQRVIAQGEEAIEEERTLRAMIGLTREMLLERERVISDDPMTTTVHD
jgi:hypothetical protein